MYCQQAIPSPYRMPPYEHMEKLQVSRESLISSIVMLHESVDALPTIPAVVDVSGRRVSAYMDLVCTAYEIQCQRRFLSSEAFNFLPFEDEPNHQSRRSILCNLLSSLRSKGGLYNSAYTFQSRAVTFIRGNRPKNKVLCLPAATDDETTKAGTGAIVNKFFRLSDLIIPANRPTDIIPAGAQRNDKVKWANPSDIDSRWMLLVGDGLSFERFRNYKDDLTSKQASFCTHYEETRVVLRALGQVVFLPGDLHGGCFHTLGPVYSLFYGGFLQPIQVALGFKRIDASKVENTYIQASILALKVLTECERQAYDAFVNQMSEATMLSLAAMDDAASVSDELARQFQTWFDCKLATSTDEVFRFGLHFIKVMRLYKLFRTSIRMGDAIAIESCYARFAPVWAVLGKHIYVEIALSQMETLYGRAPYWLLQLARDNRTGRLHDGNDKDGRPLAEWSVDGTMESFQHRYKNMAFKNDIEARQ